MSETGTDDRLRSAMTEIDLLRTLGEASKLINSSIDGEALYDSILTVAKRELDVEQGSLFFVDPERGELAARINLERAVSEIRLEIGQGLAGAVAETGESVLIDDPYADPRFDRSFDERSGFRTRSLLCAPIRNRDDKIVGVLQLLNKRGGAFGQSDLDFLEALSEHMAIAIDNAMLHVDRLAKNRMQRELQLGREIQGQLLPEPPDDLPGNSVVARCRSCYEISGDFYDFVHYEDGDIGIALGDVSGKGVASALISSSLQAALRMAAPTADDLATMMARLNNLLHGLTQARKYVTFFYGRYRPSTGELRYVNAGHLPPLVCQDAELKPLPATGKPIGLFANLEWRESQTTVPIGATLLVYTDGFTEAMNPHEEELGDERFLALVRASSTRPLPAVCDQLYDAVTEFEAGTEPGDDKTLVLLRRSAS